MKIIEQRIDTEQTTYPMEHIGLLSDILFVDIETTGFSAKTSCLYLIGCITFKENIPYVIQYFAENASEECEVLQCFFDLCKSKKILIHYNGNTFDLPYMKHKATTYQLVHPFDAMDGIDIYKRTMPYKNLLSLENCKQKTIESFLEIKRDDEYTGGELITIYKDYCNQNDSEKEKLLLLHNFEDMLGMIKLLPMLTYSDIFLQPFRVVKVQANHYADENGSIKDEILMKIKFPYTFPKDISYSKLDCYFHTTNSDAYLKVPLYHEEMKYFYANYKDYYYLSEEDLALHKSVATFVDKNYREQATASTCYTRKESLYLPQWDIIFQPIFKRQYIDKIFYFELTDDMKKQPSIFQKYALHILDMILHSN